MAKTILLLVRGESDSSGSAIVEINEDFGEERRENYTIIIVIK
jgi:hypothetical protein